MHDEVDAEVERALEKRRRPGVVTGDQSIGLASDGDDRLDVGDGDQGVARRLHPDQGGPRADGLPQRLAVGHVDGRDFEAPARKCSRRTTPVPK